MYLTVLPTSLTNTRLCSFIHINILTVFTAGTVHISFIARFIEHLIPQNTVRIDFFKFFLWLLKVFSYFWSDEKRRRRISLDSDVSNN